MALFYVLSLYLWSKKNRFQRDDPHVIGRRFISVTISCIVSVLFLFFVSKSTNVGDGHFLNEWIGFKFDSTDLLAYITGTLLTIVLFIGPIVQDMTNIYLDYKYVCDHTDNLQLNSEIK